MAAAPDRLDQLRIDRDDADRAAPPRRRRRAGLIVVAALVVAAAGAGWWLLRPRPAEVAVAPVEQVAAGSAAGAVLNASGYVTARREATVSSKVTGKVVEVLIEEGMKVTEGQVLARLDDTAARAQLRLAEAQLASARKAQAEIEVRIDEADKTLGRTRGLRSSGVVAQADLDAAEAADNALKAQLEVQRQDAVVAERVVAVRRQELDDTVIRAPFDGVVVSKDAQPGEMISPVSAGGGFTRTGIGTVVDMASLEIEVDVNESYINRVEPGQRVEAVLDSYPDWHIPAHVITPVPTADRQKATVKVRVAFDQLDPRMLPDMGVKVAFLSAPAEGAAGAPAAPRLVVPRAALRKDGDADVVFVLRGERVERRAVRRGAEAAAGVEVLAGLAAGDQVVTEGPATLADGDRVRVKPRS
jgi:RND family efflux transporter MFP subunit